MFAVKRKSFIEDLCVRFCAAGVLLTEKLAKSPEFFLFDETQSKIASQAGGQCRRPRGCCADSRDAANALGVRGGIAWWGGWIG